ncbi:placenta-specific protein 9 [Discoglossus pictus]
MQIIIPITFFLLVLGDSLTDADPVDSFHGQIQSNDWCNEHRRLHQRLEVVEERVEKTVEFLYSEVNSLLDTIVGASWALPAAPGAPHMDIFEDDSR